MSRRETYETRTEELLQPIVERFGVEIYDVEYVKEGSDWYLRAYIDKPEGVSINDCENVSRALLGLVCLHDFLVYISYRFSDLTEICFTAEQCAKSFA